MKTSSKSPLKQLLQPTILTAIVVGLGGAFALAFPWLLVVIYLSILPFPVFLVWVGRDAPSAADVIAQADAAHATRKQHLA